MLVLGMSMRFIFLILAGAMAVGAGSAYVFFFASEESETSLVHTTPTPSKEESLQISIEPTPQNVEPSTQERDTNPQPSHSPVSRQTTLPSSVPTPPIVGNFISSMATSTPSVLPANSEEPPLKLKGIGVNFEDFKFTNEKFQFNRPFMGFGFIIPGESSSTGADKVNPQPTYVVPLGTPVRSIVDGVVAAVSTLWSGDVSIQVTADGRMQKWIYETEHVINPRVKVGDKVIAGQIIGEVSNFSTGAPTGYGTVEIGILKGGQTPEHVCPFAYLDDSIKEDTFAKLKNLFNTWEEYIGDHALYADTDIPGCVTLNPIEG